ncbi:hypothetical protein B9T11_08540 [Wohlfahrtiimonas chitiniclastica]|uniref:nuclease-related domain-containing DEAD/DEAH box helicase n=1 Tax=Wohlfahrtiimonas chitiniclastica TaxID=400946 RepID=UPI000B981CDF|nr:NERD domain-containing protein/DEAD/DEAH box helicase [Wohlfahrtiimonas chitiniclastica]OYQ79272.1 hypothetical protein B9T11_08540 [Wohlfahrtiimonas chitiniclastica]
MGIVHPTFEQIDKLTVSATDGELHLLKYLSENLDDTYYIFYEPFLNGSRPDIIILKEDAGAIIIEVKDWDFHHYEINEKNQWLVHAKNGQSSIKKSPIAQAFTYKEQLFNLHLPILGLSDIAQPNKHFFGVINCFCYFHCATKEDIKKLYELPEQKIKQISGNLNNDFKNKSILYEKYNKTLEFYKRKKEQLSRDKNLSFGRDDLKLLIKKIEEKLKENDLFSKEIFDDFYRRLSPPDFIVKQNIPKYFDKKQQSILQSSAGFSKVKGVAGCGKTTLIAHRIIGAYLRVQKEGNHPNILVLTYNITLCNYISDKLTEAQQGLKDQCTIINYHQFFLQQANEYGLDIDAEIYAILNDYSLSIKQQQDLLDNIFKTDIFKTIDISNKYTSIFVDEIQDFESEWVKIIRDNFLIDNGEMVLFGDQSQNIYDREGMKGRASSIVKGFGRWIELKKSYRFHVDSPLILLFQKFQRAFLLNSNDENLLLNADDPANTSLSFDIIKHNKYPIENIDISVQKIYENIRFQVRSYKYHPNDIVILASKTDILKALEKVISKEENTAVMFETELEERGLLAKYLGALYSDHDSLKESREKLNNPIKKTAYQRDIEMIRRRKKNFFYQNSGKVKLATIHSYKGFESKIVFFIVLPEDNAELIYTSMTRCREDLYIYDLAHNQYSQFFEDNIEQI